MTIRITTKWLKDNYACKAAVRAFAGAKLDGATLTQIVRRAATSKSGDAAGYINWLFRSIMTDSDRSLSDKAAMRAASRRILSRRLLFRGMPHICKSCMGEEWKATAIKVAEAIQASIDQRKKVSK